MSWFQRIKNILFGIVILLFAFIMLVVPAESYDLVVALISLSLFIYGCRLLYYYFSMARYMVGGKITLYQALIVLDVSMFTSAMASMSSYTILIYLLGVYVFTGVIDVLRAFESKRNGSSHWKIKLISGFVKVIFAVVLVVFGVILRDQDLLVYGYCISLLYSGLIKIISAFKKTAIVYIQ